MTRRRLLLALLVLALVLVAPYAGLAGYRFAARKLLSGPGLRKLVNVRPQDFQLDYDEAVSLRPGRVTIRNLRLRGSDPNVQWFLRLENAEVDFSVLSLLRHTFQCGDVRGSGLAFALRGKLPPQDADEPSIAFLPPIAGFPDPPLKSPDDKFFVDPHAWSIDIRHVAIDRFEDIWVNGLRYRGKASVEGGFFLRPLNLARIDAAAIRLDGGTLQIGEARDGMTLSGAISAMSKPFAPLRSPMPGALREFTANVKLAFAAAKLETLQDVVALPEGLRLEGGTATVSLDAAVEGGIANGKLSLAVRNGRVRIPKYRLRGQASVDVPIRRWDLLQGPFDVSGTRVALTDVHSTGADEARAWWGKVEVPSGRVGATVFARVGMSCRDARPLLAVLGVDLPPWSKGLVKLDDFSATAVVAAAPATLRVKDLDAKGGGFQIEGSYAHDGGAASGAFLVEKGILILGIEIAPTKTSVRPLFARQWYAKQKAAAAAGR